MPSVSFVTSLPTPIGCLRIEATERGIARIEFEEDPGNLLENGGRSSGLPGTFLSACISQLQEYFAGSRRAFTDLPLAFAGTEFQSRVWEAAAAIPFGMTATYGAIANAIGEPMAARAVGTALGRNPLAIIVPCHRIISEDKDGGGYAWGMARKKWLLRHEQWKMEN